MKVTHAFQEHPDYRRQKNENIERLESVRALLQERKQDEAQRVAVSIQDQHLREMALILIARTKAL